MNVIDPAQTRGISYFAPAINILKRDKKIIDKLLESALGPNIKNSDKGKLYRHTFKLKPKNESFKNLSKIILIFNGGNEIIIDAERIEKFNLSLKKTNISKIVRRKR